uniref:Uncharacterized protein n=1 Tax=Arundo donax TaxID=35708 RepID=A0A0A9AZQ5_ARUDO
MHACMVQLTMDISYHTPVSIGFCIACMRFPVLAAADYCPVT